MKTEFHQNACYYCGAVGTGEGGTCSECGRSFAGDEAEKLDFKDYRLAEPESGNTNKEEREAA